MPNRWPSNLLRSPRSAGVGVVAALVAGSLALAFGSGYVANKAVFSGSSAWVRDGDDAVLVSAGGGAPQARVQDVGEGDLVTGPDGTMVFTSVDDATGATSVERYDPDTAGDAARTIDGAPGTRVVANDAGTWRVSPTEGTVTALDPNRWEPAGDVVTLDGGLVGEALGTDGALWVLDGDGAVTRIDGDGAGSARTVAVDDPSKAVLAVAGDRAVVVDPVAGRLLVVGGATHDVAALRGARLLVAASQPGPWLVLGAVGVDGARALVALPASGEPTTAELGAAPIGAPLAVGGRAHVPTVVDGAEQLRRFSLPGLDEVDEVALPEVDDDRAGDRPDPDDGALGFETFLVGTRLWANDPRAVDALTIGDDGEPRPVAKVLPEADGSGDDPDEVDPEQVPDEQQDPPPAPPVLLPELPSPGTAPVPGSVTPAPGSGGGAPLPGAGTGGTTPSPTPTTPTTPIEASTPTTVVPDLEGTDQDTACEALAEAQLACRRNGVADQDRTEGEVYDQSVEAGERVDVGSAVEITFAVWGEVEVPDVTGMAPEAAVDAFTAVGLAVEPAPTNRTDATADTLMNQVDVASLTHAIGDAVKVNTPITFDYYTQYAPIPYDPTGTQGVDTATADACAPLVQQGFRGCTVAVGAPAPDRTATNRTYEVSPPAGTPEVRPFDPITVTFYGAVTEAASPPFPGGCPEVAAWATANGIANVTCNTTAAGAGPAPVGAVVSQNPAPGVAVGSGDTVTINVYEPARAETPDWFRVGTGGRPSANHVLNTVSPQGGLAGTWTYNSTFGFLANPEPNAVQMSCWFFDDGTLQRPECHPGTVAPDPARAPSSGYAWNAYSTTAALFAWTGDPGSAGRTRALVSCRLIRRGTEYLGQYWSSGVGANGSWCVTPDDPVNSAWVPGETIYVLA